MQSTCCRITGCALRKIDKRTWENTTDFLINPEGEIINIYSLNEDYMIITDEVKGGAGSF